MITKLLHRIQGREKYLKAETKYFEHAENVALYEKK